MKEYSSREINKADINVSKYIKYADLASKNNVQVNWKYVASIVAVLNKNKLKTLRIHKYKKYQIYLLRIFLKIIK